MSRHCVREMYTMNLGMTAKYKGAILQTVRKNKHTE